MQRAIDLTNRHRDKQIRFNMEHGIVPRQIVKTTESILGTTSVIERAAEERVERGRMKEGSGRLKAAEDDFEYGKPKETERPTLDTKQFMAMTKEQLRKEIRERQRKMQLSAKELDFMAAARFRDEIKALQQLLESAR